MLQIVEKLLTISGEAPIIGKPVYLIRFSYCNLNCRYCDTPNKEEINFIETEASLIDEIKKIKENYPYISILLTGGEPLLDERKNSIFNIIEKLKDLSFYIETNGSIKIDRFDLYNSHFIIDWKAPSSRNEIFVIDNLKKLRKDNDCIKFVVGREDLNWLEDKVLFINKEFPEVQLYVSPQYKKIKLKELANFILEKKLPLNLSFQFHKIIWKKRKEGIKNVY